MPEVRGIFPDRNQNQDPHGCRHGNISGVVTDLETENPLEYPGYEEKIADLQERQNFMKQLLWENAW